MCRPVRRPLVEPQLLPTVMRISVHDHVFSPSACTLLHTFISQDYASIVARSSLLEGALTNNGGTRCFARRQPNTPVEFALESYLGSLAEDDDATQYVEYWTRPNWAHVRAHADIDEYHTEVSPESPARHPTSAHVLYLSVAGRVRGPTCVWEGSGASPFGGAMAVVPAVAGRVLRFDGSLQHAVPKPAGVWLDPPPPREAEAVRGTDDARGELGGELERSVVLFNTWHEPPTDLLRDLLGGPQRGGWSGVRAEDVRCAPRTAWRRMALATPIPQQQSGVRRLALLGAEARRGCDEDAHELPVSERVVRLALEQSHTATRVPPPLDRAAAAGGFRRLSGYPHGLSLLMSEGSSELKHAVGVGPLLAPAERERIVAHLSRPSFAWTSDRHALHATTDVQTAALPWLDVLLQPHLRETLLPRIAGLFQVEPAQLLLRDMFVVRYALGEGAGAEGAGQASLEPHWDESCFSFIVQLNPLDEFTGGGTRFAHASEALSVAPGEAMVFCGYNVHEGVAIRAGVRYLLTGFVDLRAPASVLARFTCGEPVADEPAAELRRLLTGFASPQLPFNVATLASRYQASGEALLRAIAYTPPAIAHLDMAPLASRCDAWLSRGECQDEFFYRFLCEVIGEGEADEG